MTTRLPHKFEQEVLEKRCIEWHEMCMSGSCGYFDISGYYRLTDTPDLTCQVRVKINDEELASIGLHEILRNPKYKIDEIAISRLRVGLTHPLMNSENQWVFSGLYPVFIFKAIQEIWG